MYGPCARLHSQSASICRRVRQGLPTYSVVVQIISSATYSVVVHIVSAASSKDICLELSITESGPRARISSDEKTVVMPVAKVPAGNIHSLHKDYNSQPSDYKSRHQGHLPSALLGLSMSLGTLAKSKDKICSTLNLCHKKAMSGNTQCQE